MSTAWLADVPSGRIGVSTRSPRVGSVARITGRGPDDIDTRLLSFHLIHQLINFRLAETVLDRRLPPQSHEERVETILKFIKPSLRNQLRAAALESGQ